MSLRVASMRAVVATSICAGGVVSLLIPADAEAQTRTAMDVTVGARAATNPYDAAGKGTAAVAISLGLDPSLTIEHELSTFALTGSVRVDQYLSRYGTDLSGRVNADYERRLSEAATVGATATFSTTRSGISDLLRGSDGSGLSEGSPVLVDQQLFDIAGTPSRQNRASFIVRASVRPSEFDMVQASSGVVVSRVASGQGDDYRQLYTNLGYTRSLTPSTSLTARITLTDVDYSGRRDGDGQIISPLFGVNFRLSPTITASLSGGVSIARIEQGGAKRSQTGLAAQASLCRRGELTSMCINGSRDTQPSSLGGVSRATSIGLTTDRKLSTNSTLALAARYGRTDQLTATQSTFGARRSIDFFSASATLSQRLSERVFLTLSPGFDKVRDNGATPRRANYEIMAGIKIRLGRYH